MKEVERKSRREIKRKVYQQSLHIEAAEAMNSPIGFRFLSDGYDVSVQPRA
jgi:hypothetical protein